MTLGERVVRWAMVLIMVPVFSLAAGVGPASAGGTCHSAATAGRGVSVTVRGLCFGPTVLYVLPGTRVTWTNRDPVLHTVTGLGFRWGSGDSLGQGNSISYRFTAPGVYPYSCIIHPGMVGAVVVGDAGSPTAVGLAVPAAVAPPSPSAAAQVAAAAASDTNATVPASSTGGIWRTISIVAMALLVALVVTVGLQRRRSPGLGA